MHPMRGGRGNMHPMRGRERKYASNEGEGEEICIL